MGYADYEKETSCVFDYKSGEWLVYSNVPTHMTRLLKVAGEPHWKEEELDTYGQPRMIAGKWTLTSKQVRFAATPAPMSEEQRQQVTERFRAARENQKNEVFEG